MKRGLPLNDLRMGLEPATALGLHVLELVKRTEDPIGKRLIGEWPQALCWLEFGGVRWQKEQMQAFRKLKICTLMPACLIQDQESLFVCPNALFLCEGGQSERKTSVLTVGNSNQLVFPCSGCTKP